MEQSRRDFLRRGLAVTAGGACLLGAAGALGREVRTMQDLYKIRAHYYQHFDADFRASVPGEGYGGWRSGEIEISRRHTALVVMHAWDMGKRSEYPGWHRAVEYIPRADKICASVFPKLLGAARDKGLRVYHVVGGGDYYKHLKGYQETAKLAGPSPKPAERIAGDDVYRALQAFRAEKVFVGKHNEADVAKGFARLDFAPNARPVDGEPIAENAHQLFAACKRDDVNHLIYCGFAINWCLLLSPGGMRDMSERGIICSAVRDAVTAVENKESARTESHKEEALWRVALAYGFVFDSKDIVEALG